MLEKMTGSSMRKFKIVRYTVEHSVLEAENREDAALLMKYGHHPSMWEKATGETRYVLLDEIIEEKDDNN